MANAFQPLRIQSVQALTDDALLIELKRPKTFHFKSGQHLSIQSEIDNEMVFRTYSICTTPQSEKLAIGVRVLPHGIFSNWLQQNAKAGDFLNCSVPTGLFHLHPPKSHKQHNLFIAGGSGITPIVSMLEEYLERFEQTQATLLYSNRSFASTMFFEHLMQLKNRYIGRLQLFFLTSRQQQIQNWLHSRLNGEALMQLQQFKVIDLQSYQDVYLCGPRGMIDGCLEILDEHEFPQAQLHYELFTSTTISAKQVQHQSSPELREHQKLAQISFQYLGEIHQIDFVEDDHSILTAAARQGHQLPYACAGGVCGTCRAKILKGSAQMSENYALDQEDLAEHFVLTCQAIPTTDEVFLNFDY